MSPQAQRAAAPYLVVLLERYQSVVRLPSSRACVTLLERTTEAAEALGGAGARPFLCAAGLRRASRADMAAATGFESCQSVGRSGEI